MIQRTKATFRFFFDSETSLSVKLFFLAAIVYVFFPVDLVPDVIPFFGWLDDLGAATLATAFLWKAVSPYMEANGSKAAAPQQLQQVVTPPTWGAARRSGQAQQPRSGYPRGGSWGHAKHGAVMVETEGVELS